MASVADQAVRAQGGGLVSPLQVKAMITTARRAFAVQQKEGMVDEGVDFDAWRRANLHDVVGSAASGSFLLVTQRDYAAVIAYFGELAGEENGEWKMENGKKLGGVREDDERRRALWALDRAENDNATAFGGVAGARKYADSLLWEIHQTDRQTASARQIWAVIFTIKKRAAARRSKTAL